MLVRLTNLGDRYDNRDISEINTFIKLQDLAIILYKLGNGASAGFNSVNILEVTLSGNQDYRKMR